MLSDRALRTLLRSDALAALAGDVIRVVVGIVVVGLIAAWLGYYALLGRAVVTTLHLNDFGKFYYSTRLFLEGRDMYGPNPATEMPVGAGSWEFRNMNPPHFHALLLPIAPMAPGAAILIWLLASLASLGACIMVILRELRLRMTVRRSLWGLLALLTFAGSGTVVITAQVSLLLLLPITFSWIAARRGRWTRAGAWLGLAMSVKPFLLIFLPYLLLRRRVAAAASALLTAGAACAGGLIIFGVPAYASWLRTLGSADWMWAAMNASFLGVLSRTLADSPYFTPVALLPDLVRPLWLGIAAAAAVLTLAAAGRDRSSAAVDRAFVVLLVGSQLVSPLGWIYYLWLPLGPMAGLAASWWGERQVAAPAAGHAVELTRWRNWLLVVAAPGLCVPLALVVSHQPSSAATVTLGSAYFWGAVLLWTSALVDWRRVMRADAR